MDVFAVQLGNYLRARREASHLSQAAVAELLGMDAAKLSRLENGKSQCSVEMLVRYLGAVGADAGHSMEEIAQLHASQGNLSL